ncbi:MAG: undecaprenyl-diphosphate phosphatase [Pseudomonadota bacterium]
MDMVQAIVLAFLQGITEFLPISSSAHLILVPKIMNWEDKGLVFDVALHVGTVLAVILYFKSDLADILSNWVKSFSNRKYVNEKSKTAWYIIIACLPILIAGFYIENTAATEFRSVKLIGYATIFFGLLLWYADTISKKTPQTQQITARHALLIGFFQVFALIPGASRSGITITGGLISGLNRKQSIKFSFLISIPVILSAGIFEARKIVNSISATELIVPLVAAAVAGITAYYTIHFFLKLIEKIGFLPFIIYRIVIGLSLIIYSG